MSRGRQFVRRVALSRELGLRSNADYGKDLSMRKLVRKSPPFLSHQWLDLVDLAIHRAIARKIRRNPSLYKRAQRTLTRWERAKRACPPPLREWQRILRENDMRAVLRIITRAGEEGNRLRSTAPFCDILTQREVEAVWSRYDPA